MFKAQKQRVKKVAPKLNKAERFVLKCVKDNDIFKGKELYLRVYNSVASKLGNNRKLPPEYSKAMKTLAAELKI